LPVGALIRAEEIFYLVYDRGIDPRTRRSIPLVMVIDWGRGEMVSLGPVLGNQRWSMDVFVPDFEKAARVA